MKKPCRLPKKNISLSIGLILLTFNLVANAQDRISKILDKNYIWNVQDTTRRGDLHVVFRKTFNINYINKSATLTLFAYNRFSVFINGKYLMRGPVRFENRGPEYAGQYFCGSVEEKEARPVYIRY